jgi:glycosyltransferase involved in cell wall biosynthesis
MISVIVPVFNAESSIKKCVESIQNQGIEDLEIILVNDGSKDRSLKICDELSKKDSRVIVVDKENGGAASARNQGLNLCSGEYVCFVDADDFLPENYLATLLSKIKNVDYVIVPIKILRDDNANVNEVRKFNMVGEFGISDFPKLLSECHYEGVFSSCCNKIFKKKLITSEFKNILIGEDKFFNYDYLKNCSNFCVTNEVCYNYVYYSNPNSVTKLYKEGKFDNILMKHELELNAIESQFGEQAVNDYKKFFNRNLLRDLTSITVGLLFSGYSHKKIRSILRSWLLHNQIRTATKNYKVFDMQEKIIFKLIKYKLVSLIMLLCKLKGDKK